MTEPVTTPPPGCPAHADAAPLYGPRFQTDPGALYQELRDRHGPVAPVELAGGVPAWLVIGYRELQLVTGQPKVFGRDSTRWNQWPTIPEDWPLKPMMAPVPSILYAEGAEHQRRSSAVTDALSAVDPYELRIHAEEIADRLIDGFAGRGEADLVAEYAHRLPLLVLCRLFGLDEDEAPVLIRGLLAMLDGGADAQEGAQQLLTVMLGLVHRRREIPAADVTSRLLAHEAGLNDEEVMRDLRVLLIAGHQPLAYWISNALRLMLTDERFAASLSGGRRSIGQALGEALWEDTPTQIFAGRWATRDVHLGGQRIAKGDMVLLGFAGANADPTVRQDSGRPAEGNRAYLSFSAGDHGCPYPAREAAEVIANTAIEVLLDRLPDLRLAVSESALVWRPSAWVRGLMALPVAFTPGYVAE
ncbi:cytochrome P450 [Kitasatospora sp. DSM 101779]|uniref:cytochrome P450 n=1 Tax=Kitasatospora sp. DSM 101779 TaxID=2853165 RepID=UPI0021D9DE5E|nr:cytochrome P450 [Kitasatospora sp. DSM 101779]MCU7822570.1 cytochrome P450 [Kitasatospora sp. DSM 101779]